MKRILSLILIVVMLSSCCAFAQTLDDAGIKPWAKVPFLNGTAGSFSEAGVVMLEHKGVITRLASNFANPTGLAVDPDGNLFISDTGTGLIYRITPTGKMDTFYSGLYEPSGLCWAKGKLYVAETGKNRIIAINGNKLEVVAGQEIPDQEKGVYDGGYVNGSVDSAEFDHPQGVAVADDGRIFVADTNNHAIRVIQNKRVYTITGSHDLSSDIIKPAALTVSGNILSVTDRFTGNITEIDVAPKTFTDLVPGAWYEDYVKEAVLCGIIGGTDSGNFSPSAGITRSEFVCLIANLYLYTDGNAVIQGDSGFVDIPEGASYKKEASWACDMGIALGNMNRFNGDSFIIRQQLVAMLYRYAKATGMDVSKKADISSYSDYSQISSYAKDAFAWAVANNIVNGYNDDTLRPGARTNRAQACKMMTMMLAAAGK